MDKYDYICIDYSGSTGGRPEYWERVKQIINSNKNRDTLYILWDTSANMVNKQKVLDNAKRLIGNGGTAPSCFAKILPENCSIRVVTDGQINISEVTRCDDILKSKKFKYVTFDFVNTGGEMNLSVSAPFTRNTQYEVNIVNKDQSESILGDSAKSIDLSKYTKSPELFMTEFEDLRKQIIMQNLGKCNMKLRNDLLDLQKNLLKEISSRNTEGIDSAVYENIRSHLINGTDVTDGTDGTDGTDSLLNIIRKSDTSLGKKIEGLIQECIQHCDSKDFSFDILRPNRLTRATIIKEVATEELPSVENYTGGFECPIFLDKDIPVCLILEGSPVLEGLEKNYLDFLINCPIAVLNSPELVIKIKERLDHLIGLNSLKNFSKPFVSPFTRRNISSTLSFGPGNIHDKSNKYALANLFFGNKLVGNPYMWLSVVYLVIRDIEYLQKPDFQNLFETYLKDKLRNNYSNLTLTGLPIEPMIKAPLDVSIWYCVNSDSLIRKLNLPEECNRLRAFGSACYHLMKLLDLLGYSYDKKNITHRLKVYSTFNWMMNQEKNNVPLWKQLVRSLYQNFLILDDETIIMLDGPPVSSIYVPEFNDLPPNELYTLSTLVDRHETNGSIVIPESFPKDIPKWVKNYGYPGSLKLSDYLDETHICPRTFRPYTFDPKNKTHWKKLSEEKFGPLDQQLSSYNYFIKYVHEFNEYPNRQEFIKYLANKQENRELKKDTLPMYVVDFVEDVFSSYEKVLGKDFKDVKVNTFKEVTNSSMPQKTRPLLE